MEGVEKVANQRLTALEDSIQEINWDRKTEQERIGGDLLTLETRWPVTTLSHPPSPPLNLLSISLSRERTVVGCSSPPLNLREMERERARAREREH